MKKKALEQFKAACDALRDAGISVVACTAHYDSKAAHFSTRLSLHETPEAGVTKDHVLLDALREISTQWSKASHSKKGR